MTDVFDLTRQIVNKIEDKSKVWFNTDQVNYPWVLGYFQSEMANILLDLDLSKTQIDVLKARIEK